MNLISAQPRLRAAASVETARNSLTRGVLASAIVAGSLAFWTVVPGTWLYVTGDLVPHGGARFVLVLFGCPLTMCLVFMFLRRVESFRRGLTPVSKGSAGVALLEIMLVVSAVIALVGLVLWWSFVADAVDPSGPLQPV